MSFIAYLLIAASFSPLFATDTASSEERIASFDGRLKELESKVEGLEQLILKGELPAAPAEEVISSPSSAKEEAPSSFKPEDMKNLTKAIESLSADIQTLKNKSSSIEPLPKDKAALEGSPSKEEKIPLKKPSFLPAGSLQAQYDQASSLLKKEEWASAAEAFDYFISTYPKSDLIPQAHYNKGLALLNDKKVAEAKAAFVKSYKAGPDSSKANDALIKMAECLIQEEKKEDGCVVLKKVAKGQKSLSDESKKELTRLLKGCSA